MKQFFEFKGLKPLVKTVADLFEKTALPGKQRFTISADVADFVRLTALAPTTPALKGCKFQLLNGVFIEFDGKGKATESRDVPDWAMEESTYSREQYIVNKGYDVKTGVELIAELMEMTQRERREYADILLDLGIHKMRNTAAPYTTTGNRNGKSTKPKVMDLGSFEYFKHFYDRLSEAANNDVFPTLQILTGHEDLTKAPTNLKQACRTYFKAITSELPPNNKVVEKGHPEIMCARYRAILEEIERVGVEAYYKQLAEAIGQAQDAETTIADFKFRFTEEDQTTLH